MLTSPSVYVLEPLASGRLRITYSAEIKGPVEAATHLGPIITADFPDTIANLGSMAERRAR